MSNLAYIDEEKIWTYGDVKKLKDRNRYEIINGKLYMLASPTTIHQQISGEMATQIYNFFRGKTCQPFCAPLDIDIEKKGDKATKLVQPDIFVVCDKNKVREKNIFGVPDFVIEILSPNSDKKDKMEKYDLYEKHRVKEYWIVNPVTEEIQIYLLENEKYVYKGKQSFLNRIRSNIFPELEIDLHEIATFKKMFLHDEDEKYEVIEEKMKECTYRYVDYDLGKYEKQVLQYILSLKDKWDYEEDVMELGAFRKLFELMDGDLVYRGYNVIHFN